MFRDPPQEPVQHVPDLVGHEVRAEQGPGHGDGQRPPRPEEAEAEQAQGADGAPEVQAGAQEAAHMMPAQKVTDGTADGTADGRSRGGGVGRRTASRPVAAMKFPISASRSPAPSPAPAAASMGTRRPGVYGDSAQGGNVSRQWRWEAQPGDRGVGAGAATIPLDAPTTTASPSPHSAGARGLKHGRHGDRKEVVRSSKAPVPSPTRCRDGPRGRSRPWAVGSGWRARGPPAGSAERAPC